MSERNTNASEIAADILELIKEAADATIIRAMEADRVGTLGDRVQSEIDAGKRIDTRIPTVLSVSGKGGPGHDEWRNVTLFDHSSSVAMQSATFAARDILEVGETEEDARICAAVAFAVGMLHDVDKLPNPEHRPQTELVADSFERYRIRQFLDRFGVTLAADQFGVLVSHVEGRTAHTVTGARVPGRFVNTARRYVKLADNLEAHWLKGLPVEAAADVARTWNSLVSASASFVSRAFKTVRPLVVSDPHHPLIMSRFADEIDDACRSLTGLPPLLHTVCDETLISVLPVDGYTDIVAQAAKQASSLRGLFDSAIAVTPAGIPNATGAKPTYEDLKAIIALDLAEGKRDIRALLLVRSSTLPEIRVQLADLAASARVPLVNLAKVPSGKTMAVSNISGADDLGFETTREAALVSFAIGAEGHTKVKSLSRVGREAALVALLGDEAAHPLCRNVDALNRRTALALATTSRARRDAVFADMVFGPNGLFATWFATNGVFAQMEDKAAAVRAAVQARLLALAEGQEVVVEDATHTCLITGEPVSGPPVGRGDGLYGIKSSAFSNRLGTPESRFREDAEVRLSPVSYAEYRLRGSMVRGGDLSKLPIPVRLCSPTAAGMSSLAMRAMPLGECGLFDMVRADREKRHVGPFESFTKRLHLGRFETLPGHFADRRDGNDIKPGRVSFVRIAMRAALRFGRPLHIFSGLAHPRREFFFFDALDPELRCLLGKNGFRIEELPDAIEKLNIVARIAAPNGRALANPGLAMIDTAREFCLPATRLGAACLAWQVASTSDNASIRTDLAAVLSSFIEREVESMQSQSNVAPPVLLGQLAVAIQRQPRSTDGNNDKTLLFKLALEQITLLASRGISDRDSLIAAIAAKICDHGDRRMSGSKGFYASKRRRPEGQTPKEAIDIFAAAFVDTYWLDFLRGRGPRKKAEQQDIAMYWYAFTHPAVILVPEVEDAEAVTSAEGEASDDGVHEIAA